MRAADDGTLFERWLDSQDGDAFAELARRHAPVVYDLAVRAAGDPVLAEDLVQEALLDLALTRTRKPIQVGLVSWLARYAICRGRNQRAAEVSRRRRQRIVGERRREEVMPDNRLEHSEELENALERAEPEERVVLAMRYLHGWDYARIAAALTVSEGAARVRVHRALSNVRRRLGVGAAPTETGTNGNGNGNGNKLLGGLAALPAFEMPSGLLEMSVQTAVETAKAQLAAGGAGSVTTSLPRPRLPRFTLEALGLATLLAVAASASLPVGPSFDERTAVAHGATAAPLVASAAAERVLDGAAAAPGGATGGLPRPPEWDDGELARVGPGADLPPQSRAEPDTGAADAARDETRSREEQAATPAPRGPLATIETAAVRRPTSRGACAATCDPVSSVDERAGIPVVSNTGPAGPVPAPVVQVAILPDAAAHAAAPGLPGSVQDHDAKRTASRRAPAPAVALSQLPPEQVELIEQATGLVRDLVGDDVPVDALDAALPTRRDLRKQRRRARKEYRRIRRDLREAALSGDPEAIERQSAEVGKIAAVNQALDLLLDLANGATPGAAEPSWPDSDEMTAALQDVILILTTQTEWDDEGTSEPDEEPMTEEGPLPDGAMEW